MTNRPVRNFGIRGFSPYQIVRQFAIISMFGIQATAFGQLADSEEQFDSLYALRISLAEINGVYIPVDLEDSFRELQRLSSAEDIEKFKSAPEEIVRDKLHFGLGRWIYVNWGFYLGSRFSHYLRSLGLEHPDDMTKFVIVSFHRHLNGEDLRIDEQVEYYKKQRERERQERLMRQEVLLDTTIIRNP